MAGLLQAPLLRGRVTPWAHAPVEYLVELPKPIGLRFDQDATTGEIRVLEVVGQALESGLVRIGDVLTKASLRAAADAAGASFARVPTIADAAIAVAAAADRRVLVHADNHGLESTIAAVAAAAHCLRGVPVTLALEAASTVAGVDSARVAVLFQAVAAELSPGFDRPASAVVRYVGRGSDVRVIGDVIGSWEAGAGRPMARAGPGAWEASVVLTRGRRYAYKFVVDGAWAVGGGQAVERDAAGNENHVLRLPPLPGRP